MMQWNRYDQDADAWIRAVEIADAQYLELPVKDLMNQLVVELKEANIWSKIQASAILMGARTIAGAMVDMKFPYFNWINNNFVSGDYNRVTGLLGNGSTKYLNSALLDNTMAQDDIAMWVMVHTEQTGVGVHYCGVGTGSGSTRLRTDNATTVSYYSRNTTLNATSTTSHAVGLIGSSRNVAATFTARGNQTNVTETRTSQAATGTDIYTFATNNAGTPNGYSNGRIRACVIGNAHDLELAETIMQKFIDSMTYLLTADSDATAYINAVEAADVDSLEPGVKVAVNQLVLDLKANSLWTPIATMILPMVSRTLTGALIDVKTPGSSWTNNNFVSADYVRGAGLKGNGSTKYLDTGRNNNTDGQNNQAMWAYSIELPTGTWDTFVGAGANDTGTSLVRATNVANEVAFRSRNSTGAAQTDGLKYGLFGISRSASGSYTSRAAQTSTSRTSTSQTPYNANIYAWGATNAASSPSPESLSYSNHRGCAVAIGAAHDLAVAETVMNTFIDNMGKYIVTDPDAQTYIAAVEAADGETLELKVKLAINRLIVNLKRSQQWDCMTVARLYSGPRTLAGCAVPLKGVAPTLNNFVSSDIDRINGLKADGSTKYVDHNFDHGTTTQNDFSMGLYVTELHNTSATFRSYMGVASGTTGNSLIHQTTTADQIGSRCQSSNVSDTTASVLVTGMFAITRSVSGQYFRRANNAVVTVTKTSQAPLAGDIFSFGHNNAGVIAFPTSSRHSFEWIGTNSSSLASINTALNTFYADMNLAL